MYFIIDWASGSIEIGWMRVQYDNGYWRCVRLLTENLKNLAYINEPTLL